MLSRMRTTLIIDDAVFRELKKLAAEQNQSLSRVTQEVLQRGLKDAKRPARHKAVRLPAFSLGRPRVDIADRDQLYDILDRT